MNWQRAVLYARTAARLKPAQILDRPLRGLRRALPLGMTDPAGGLDPRCAAVTQAWRHPDLARAGAIVAGDFTFLSHTEQFSTPPWRDRVHSHLWSYHLQYFDWFVDLAAATRATGDHRYARRAEELVTSWIRATADRRGDAWDPYPTAVRIQSWIRALHLFPEAAVGGPTRAAILSSLRRQVRHLERNIEYHLLGNHIQKDFAALALASLALDGVKARTIRVALQRLCESVEDQVLGDGCHAERSPMYHVIALVDFLEVAAFARAVGLALPLRTQKRLGRMVGALNVLARNSGGLHLFNDSALGEAPPVAVVHALATMSLGSKLLAPAHSLPDGGYHLLQTNTDRVIFDAGPLGPAHQPGHGHCDVLSFEWDHDGVPVFVDSGCSGYAEPLRRAYERSTAAHNTVRIGQRDQAELWDSFRVARTPRITLQPAADHPGDLHGAVLPFHSARFMHSRHLRSVRSGLLEVNDEVTRGAETASAFLHFHPHWELAVDRNVITGAAVFEGKRKTVRVVVEGAKSVTLVRGDERAGQGWYAERFGIAVPAPVAIIELGIDPADGIQKVRTRAEILST